MNFMAENKPWGNAAATIFYSDLFLFRIPYITSKLDKIIQYCVLIVRNTFLNRFKVIVKWVKV